MKRVLKVVFILKMSFPLSSNLQFNSSSMHNSVINCWKTIKKEQTLSSPCRYLSLLARYPVMTKAIASALLTLLGDIICQVNYYALKINCKGFHLSDLFFALLECELVTKAAITYTMLIRWTKNSEWHGLDLIQHRLKLYSSKIRALMCRTRRGEKISFKRNC